MAAAKKLKNATRSVKSVAKKATRSVKSAAKKVARKVDKLVAEPIADMFRSDSKSKAKSAKSKTSRTKQAKKK